MLLLDGRKLRKKLSDNLRSEVNRLNYSPSFVIINVGEDPASKVYIKHKVKFAEKVGISSKVLRFPSGIPEEEIKAVIEDLNASNNVNGIIVQLPLPKNIDAFSVINTINYKKDIDGLTYVNGGLLMVGRPMFVPATPLGILILLKEYNIEVEGKHCVVVGRSNLVGRPISVLLSQKPYNATVTLVHSKTPNIKDYTCQADILIVAVGKPNLITSEYIKNGAVVVDVGINRIDGKIVGDVAFNEVKDIVSAITPVPGGVGPMTVLALMYNVLKAYKIQNGITIQEEKY